MLVPAPACEGCSEADWGIDIITSARVVRPCLTRSSALMVVTGRASSAARRLMLEPVTSTRCMEVDSCWADACWLRARIASVIEERTRVRGVARVERGYFIKLSPDYYR